MAIHWTTGWQPIGGERVRGCGEEREFSLAGVRHTLRVEGGYGAGSGRGTYRWRIERLIDGRWETIATQSGWGCTSKREAMSLGAGRARLMDETINGGNIR